MIDINKKVKTEEVQDIIDRMPKRTGLMISVGIAVFTGILFFLASLIKYPESVSGQATISAEQSPVRLTCPTSGRLQLLVENRNLLKGGELFAYIESGTDINDFFMLDSLLVYSPIQLLNSFEFESNQLTIGELTIPFLKFTNSIRALRLHKKDNSFQPKFEQFNVKKHNLERMLLSLNVQLVVQEQSKEMLLNNLRRDSIQYFKLKSINEAMFFQTKTLYLNLLQNLNTTKKEIGQALGSMEEVNTQISQLRLEQKGFEDNLDISLLTSFSELKNQVNLWKQKYAFVSPFEGELEMLDFFKNNTYLQYGEDVFAIISSQTPAKGQVVIPSYGAGKVSPGQEVIIYLDDYPFLEFGSITGKVINISMLTNTMNEKNAQNTINKYLVDVELPEQLKTNYGSILSFKHDLKGSASIVVKKRKLIERLFDNLKYMVNE